MTLPWIIPLLCDLGQPILANTGKTPCRIDWFTPLVVIPDRCHTHAQFNIIVHYPRKRIHAEV